jgi:alpha,alpha-trehalase
LINPAASEIRTGQQWDAPNVWAPNSWILHEVAPYEEAALLGKQWIQTTYCSWKKTGNLYEKYHSDLLGERGEGGEYIVQTGFGWTNGLALYYLSLYGDTYTPTDC